MFQKEVLVLKEAKEDIEAGKIFYDSIEPGINLYSKRKSKQNMEKAKIPMLIFTLSNCIPITYSYQESCGVKG